MKKGTKIALWVVGSLIVLVIGIFLAADIIASKVVKREVSKALVNMPGAEASVGHIYLHLLSGSAIVTDITFRTNGLNLDEDSVSADALVPGMALSIRKLSVWNIDYLKLLKQKRLSIYKIQLDEPAVAVCMDEQHPESILPALPKDTTLDKADDILASIEVKHIEVEQLRAWLRSTSSPLDLKVDSFSVECRDIAYHFADSLFSYNDSVYALSLGLAKIALPDGMMAMEVHDLATANQGPLTLGYTRIYNTVSHKVMAKKAKDYITWIDLELNNLTTSPFNPLRKAMAQDYALDKINVDIRRLQVFRDQTIGPKEPFGTPQEYMRLIPVHFQLKEVEALARKIDVQLATTDINVGQLHFSDIQLHLANVTNRPGAIWRNRAKAPWGKKGSVEASYNIHMDKTSTFDLALSGKELELDIMNPFVRPLVGITCECHVNKIDAAYTGNNEKAIGTFCMQYNGLEVMVHKEDNIPYKIVTNNAELFTGVANALIPKSNPTAVDIHPRKYAVEWKRDEWKPYPLYMFGPCIDGIKMTMLPGLYVHKQVSYTDK